MVKTGIALFIDSQKAKKGADEFKLSLKGLSAAARKHLRSMADSAQKHFKRMKGGFLKLKAVFATLRKALFSLSGAFAVFGVALSGKALVEAGLKMERLATAIRAVSDSAADAALHMSFIDETVETLGLDLATTAKAYAQLTASARGTSLEGNRMKNIFIGVSEAARALSLSADDTSGAIRAITQMISKGTVQAEELRGQLGERIPGAFNIAAEAMGKTTRELGKMLEMGQVTAADMLPKMAKVLHERFGKGAKDAAMGTIAEFSRFNTSIFRLSATIANSGINQSLAELSKSFTKLFNDLVSSGLAESFGRIVGKSFLYIGESIGWVLSLLPKFYTGINEFYDQIANRALSVWEGVSFNDINKLFEQEKAGAAAKAFGAKENGYKPDWDDVGDGGLSDKEKKKAAMEKAIKGLDEYRNSLMSSTMGLQRQTDFVLENGVALDIQNKAYRHLQAELDATKQLRESGLMGTKQSGELLRGLTTTIYNNITAQAELAAQIKKVNEERAHRELVVKTLDDLITERNNLTLLNDARKQGIKEYKDAASSIDALNISRKIGLSMHSAESKNIKSIIGDIQNLEEELNKPIHRTWTEGAIEGLDKYRDAIKDVGSDVEDAVTNSVKGMEDTFTTFFSTGSFGFEQWADSVLNDINRILTRQLIVGPMIDVIKGFGSGGGGGILSNLFGGGSSGAGAVTPLPMATGGIVTQPTNTILGESGPEAVIPLSRMPDVMQAQETSSNVNITVSLKDETGGNVMISERQTAQQIGAAVERAMRRKA